MNGFARRAVAALALTFAVGAGAAPGALGAPAEGTPSAIDTFGSCLAAQQAGDLLLLIDESGSLQQTDDDAARVTAATYLLNRLAASAASSGFALDVAVAGFSADFEQVQDWTALDDAGLPRLLASVATFENRDDGIDTDYWTALDGARSAMAERATGAATGAARCQAIVWFSDGQLDIEARTTSAQRSAYPDPKAYADTADLRTESGAAAAEGAARESLCRAGGLADQVRSGGVAVFGIGLSGGTPPPDFGLMRSIATGDDGAGGACGSVTSPPPGEFYLVSDIDQMLFAFDRMSDPAQRPIEQTAGICQADVCAEEGHRFVLDASIRSVHILGSADVEGPDVRLVPPNGGEIALLPQEIGVSQSASTEDVGVSFTWESPKTVVVDLVEGADPAAWTGAWSLVFVDTTSSSPNGVSRSNIHITGDVFPAWLNEDEAPVLHTGEVVPGIRLGLVDADRTVIPPENLLGTISYAATLIAADGTETPVVEGLSADDLDDPVDLDLSDIRPGPATLRLDLEVTTASVTNAAGESEPGTTLAPQRVAVPVTLAAPVNYPQVAQVVDFGTFTGVVDATVPLPVTGPGCVWIEDGAVSVQASPAEIGTLSLTTPAATSAESCLRVGDEKTADMPLALSTEAPGNGGVHGTVVVHIAPLDEVDRATTVDVDFRANLAKPLNPGNFVFALVIAILLGPGIPLGLLYLLKYATAKIPARALAACRIPVTVANGQVLRENAPFALRDSDFTLSMVNLAEKGARSASADGIELRTAVGGSPFGPGFVRVVAPGMVGASSEHPSPVGKFHEARLPLAVHNTWAVLHDPRGPSDAATVLVLLGTDTSPAMRQDFADDVGRRVPEILGRFREFAEAAPETAMTPATLPPDAFVPAGAPAAPAFDFGTAPIATAPGIEDTVRRPSGSPAAPGTGPIDWVPGFDRAPESDRGFGSGRPPVDPVPGVIDETVRRADGPAKPFSFDFSSDSTDDR